MLSSEEFDSYRKLLRPIALPLLSCIWVKKLTLKWRAGDKTHVLEISETNDMQHLISGSHSVVDDKPTRCVSWSSQTPLMYQSLSRTLTSVERSYHYTYAHS